MVLNIILFLRPHHFNDKFGEEYIRIFNSYNEKIKMLINAKHLIKNCLCLKNTNHYTYIIFNGSKLFSLI